MNKTIITSTIITAFSLVFLDAAQAQGREGKEKDRMQEMDLMKVDKSGCPSSMREGGMEMVPPSGASNKIENAPTQPDQGQ